MFGDRFAAYRRGEAETKGAGFSGRVTVREMTVGTITASQLHEEMKRTRENEDVKEVVGPSLIERSLGFIRTDLCQCPTNQAKFVRV